MTLWIPVISTLLGGVLVLLGSLATAWFNKSTERRLAKEARERERLEEVYTTLVAIRSVYIDMHHQASIKILFNSSAAPKEKESNDERMPPIVRLQMLVNLYFPALRPSFSEFEVAKNDFGVKYAELMVERSSNRQLPEREELRDRFTRLFSLIDERISDMQKAVAELVDP